LAQAPVVIGDVEESDYTGSLSYTPTKKLMGKTLGYYLVKVKEFKVGGKDLGVGIDAFNTYGGMIVDSGTTELILPVSVYIAFTRLLVKEVKFIDARFFLNAACLTEDGVEKLPSLTLELEGGVKLTLPPQNYLIPFDGCYYWGVSASSMALLGNVALQGLSVVFDREKDAVGFATVSKPPGAHNYRDVRAVLTNDVCIVAGRV